MAASVVVVVAVIAGGAAALAAGGTTVWIGTGGDDVINLATQAGNFHIWGLAGADILVGGSGSNLIIGDGYCPYHNRVPVKGENDAYCENAVVPGDPGDILKGGDGPNTIFGGGGPNLIVAGPAMSGAGPFDTGNLIYGGPTGDAIDATAGSSTIHPSLGYNLIDSVGPGVDHIICEVGDKHTLVFADANDIVTNCSHVVVIGSAPKRTAERARAAFELQVACVRMAIRTRHRITRVECGANVR